MPQHLGRQRRKTSQTSHGRGGGLRRAVLELTCLRHSLLGKGAHALWNGSAETEETELARHVAVIFARLLGSSLGIGGSIHHRASGVDRSDFVGWQPPNHAPVRGAWPTDFSEKGACTELAR